MSNGLVISETLTLPLDAVTGTYLIFGRKGSGKTATAGVFAEEMIEAGLPVSILDPMDSWWGLKSSADGQGPGLPVTVFGGEHADIPLPPESGTAIADLIAEERIPAVLSLFLMSKNQQRKFVTDFMERLFHKNRDPMHLVIDECDRYAPLKTQGEMTRLVGAYEDIVLRGRRLGIGSTSITLRPSLLNPSVRSQVEALIAMRMLGKLDVNAIDEWVRLHASDEDARDLKASLPSLPVGTAWVWAPGSMDPELAKVAIRRRRTFDSSATPKVGEQRIVPRSFAGVDQADLDRLAARLGPAAEPEAKATAPKAADGKVVAALRAQVTGLTAQLAEARACRPERVEVAVLQPGEVAALEQVTAELKGVAAAIELALGKATVPARSTKPEQAADRAPHVQVSAPGPEQRSARPASAGAPLGLSAGARRILEVLGRHHPARIPVSQLGTLAELNVTGTQASALLGALEKAGLITVTGRSAALTSAGKEHVGVSGDVPADPALLLEAWLARLTKGAGKVLSLLVDLYPVRMTADELAAAAGYEAASSGYYKRSLAELRRNELVDETKEGMQAAEIFVGGSRATAR